MVTRSRKSKLKWKKKHACRGRKPAKSLPKPKLCKSNK